MESAEQELIELYTEKALKAYQDGDMAEAARCAERILHYDPEDLNALFIRGAAVCRSSKPGNMQFRQAFGIWIPLMESEKGQVRADLLDAIRYAFAVSTETVVSLAFRYWNSYRDLETVSILRDVLKELTDLETALPETEEQKAWILPLFRENYTTWVYDIVGSDLAVPTGSNLALLDAFYEMLRLLTEIALKMPPEDKGAALLFKRTKTALKNFEKLNHSDAHPERLAYLESL